MNAQDAIAKDAAAKVSVPIKSEDVKLALELIPKGNRPGFVEQAVRVFLASQEGASIFNFLRSDARYGHSLLPAAELAGAALQRRDLAPDPRPEGPPASPPPREAPAAATHERPPQPAEPVITLDSVDDIMGGFVD